MMWLVDDRDRWGASLNIVRAATEDEAIHVVCGQRRVNRDRVMVTPLPPDGPSAILWCKDGSPDTPQ